MTLRLALALEPIVTRAEELDEVDALRLRNPAKDRARVRKLRRGEDGGDGVTGETGMERGLTEEGDETTDVDGDDQNIVG